MTPVRAAFQAVMRPIGYDLSWSATRGEYRRLTTQTAFTIFSAGFRAGQQSPAAAVAGDAERPGDRPRLDVSSLNSEAESFDSVSFFGRVGV